MSSDYERIVKLWISLWTLVLEEKRHLESVCANLQKLVFEKKGWPKFKNWPAICELGKKDRLMMMVVATLDLANKNESTQRIIAAFSECFSETEVRGPIPWSILQHTGSQSAGEYGARESSGKDLLITFGALEKFDIPYQIFYYFPDRISDGDRKEGVLPITDELSEEDPTVGRLIKWRGKSWVIVEDGHDADPASLGIAPVECIDLNS